MNYTNSDSASYRGQKDSDIALETGSNCNKYNDQGNCVNEEAKVCKNIGNLQDKPIKEVVFIFTERRRCVTNLIICSNSR